MKKKLLSKSGKLPLLLLCAALALVFQSSHRAGANASAPRSNRPQRAARLSHHVTVQAAGRGNPWINLSDGREIEADFTSSASVAQELTKNQAEPLSLASADFDEDGVPDLVCGYGHGSGGILVLRRGNIDSIYPNSPEAQQRRQEALGEESFSSGESAPTPFLAGARTFESVDAPQFIGTGDFDNDGHTDVVFASAGSSALNFLLGDGLGNLGRTRTLPLPGRVTAMATGDINRRDGLEDIIVCITRPDGAQALVFEGPDGAFKATPEVIPLPVEATALAIGQLDDSYEIDLAIAAGHELLIAHGRDRRLSLDEKQQAEVPAPAIESQSLPFVISSMALGDFIWDKEHRTEIALLGDDGRLHLMQRTKHKAQTAKAKGQNAKGENGDPWAVVQSLPVAGPSHVENVQSAIRDPESPIGLVRVKVSSLPADDLIVVDGASHQLHIVTGDVEEWKGAQPAAHIPTLTDSRVAASLSVDGAAIAALPMRLNSDALSDLVILKGGSSAPTVMTTIAMMTFTVTNTNDSGAGSLRQAIEDANNNPGEDRVQFQIQQGTQEMKPLSPLPEINDPVTIDGTTQPGFRGTPIIELNGSSVPACGGGLLITGGNSVVRGLVINRCSCQAIALYGPGNNNIVEGNFLGTDVTGTVGLGSFDYLFVGVEISLTNRPVSSDNLIGGTVPAARNIIGQGLFITGQPFFNQTSSGNVVQGNFIGTDVTGTASLNIGSGAKIINLAMNNTVGGLTAGASNVISGSSLSGIDLGAVSFSTSKANLIQKNLIGTASNGVDLVGNGAEGILAAGQDNTIDRNVITFSGSEGVFVPSTSRGCRITLNRIYSNGTFRRGLGIRLAPGANNNQPAPSLSSATLGEVLATVEGSIVAAPSTTYRIEFFGNDQCDASGFGEGQTPLGSTDVTTLGSGLGIFSATVFQPLPGQTVITATATDPAGDTSEFSQCIQINHAPVVRCRNVTESADSNCQATLTPQEIDNGSSDPDGDPITLSISPSGPFNLGMTNVTLTVTDSNGASSTCTATVTVVDTTPPAVTCPADLTVSNDPGKCSAVVTYVVSATDNCSGVVVVSSPPSGSVFPVGATTVTSTATDAAGNTAICSFTVTIVDIQAPIISGVSANPSVLWPPNHKMVPVTINYGVTDNCGRRSAITCVLSVTSNEPVDGTGDGDTAPDWEIVDSHHVRLRAERAGNGSGRIYTITITCTDAGGNSLVRTVTVSVPHDQS